MNMSHICLKISVAVGMLPLVALAALVEDLGLVQGVRVPVAYYQIEESIYNT